MNSYIWRATNFTRITKNFLLHLFFPVECLICHEPAEIICGTCLKTLINENTKNSQIKDGLKIFSGSNYAGNISKIIKALKYSGYKSLGQPLGKILAMTIAKPDNLDYLIPVPLHIDSERSFNQSLEIAKGISKIWNVEILNAAVWSKIIPRRVGLNAIERMSLEDDAFAVKNDCDLKNKTAALIDDVCTTGTTLLKLRNVLEKAGANILSAYTLAGGQS